MKYIRPGLEVLEEVQRTGDIFFPKNWAAALLGNHLSSSAYEEVVRFLNERPDYSPLLKNKILQAAYSCIAKTIKIIPGMLDFACPMLYLCQQIHYLYSN